MGRAPVFRLLAETLLKITRFDSERHVTSVSVSSRTQQACAGRGSRRGALWAVG